MANHRRQRSHEAHPDEHEHGGVQLALALPNFFPSDQQAAPGGRRADAPSLRLAATPVEVHLAAVEPLREDAAPSESVEASCTDPGLTSSPVGCTEVPENTSHVVESLSPTAKADFPCSLQTIWSYRPQDAASVPESELDLPIVQLLAVYELVKGFLGDGHPEPAVLA